MDSAMMGFKSMSLSLITPPAEEPVTLAEAKAHLKVDTSDDDALIASLIEAARARAEWHTGRAFVTQDWILRLDAWPLSGIVEIPLPPLQNVTNVTVHAGDDSAATLAASTYRVDLVSVPGRIALKNALAPPVVTLRATDGIAIAFSAGYGAAAAVPQAVKQAILHIVADLYEHRGDADELVGQRAQGLLAPYRIFKL
jgi:uncharacterized phiE125 gp8 family phage protein